jgi:hypothetical protein
MEVTKTVKEIKEILEAAYTYLTFTDDRKVEYSEKASKFNWAYFKLEKVIKTKVTDWSEDAKIEHAAADDKGVLLVKDANYQYTKDGKKGLLAALRAIDERPITFVPYLCQDEKINAEIRSFEPHFELLAGVLIPTEPEPIIRINGADNKPTINYTEIEA